MTVLRASDGALGDAFGKRVAVSQGTLLVGAHGDDDRGLDAGTSYVFTRTPGGAWVEQQKLAPASLLAGDFFGWSVAIDKDVLVVGAPGDDRDTTGAPTLASANRGAAHVYRRVGGTWRHDAVLQPADLAAGDKFGAAVAISGDSILVSAIYQDVANVSNVVVPDSGAVYAFRATPSADGTTSWQQEHKFVHAVKAGGRLGFGLALAGNVASLGAPGTRVVDTFERRVSGWIESAAFSGLGPDCLTGLPPATGIAARFGSLVDVTADGDDVVALVNCAFRGVTLPAASRIAPTGAVSEAGLSVPFFSGAVAHGIARSAAGTFWWAASNQVHAGQNVAGDPLQKGTRDGQGAAARFTDVRAIDIHDGTQAAYVIDGCAIRRVTPAMEVTTVAGSVTECTHADAAGLAARFAGPRDLQVVGDDVYVADDTTIRRVVLASGGVTTVAGHAGEAAHGDGTGAAARFRRLEGLTFGSGVFTIADASTLRRMDLTGVVTTLAGDPAGVIDESYAPVDGQGTLARVAATRLVGTSGGRVVFIDNMTVREVSAEGVVHTIAGLPFSSATRGAQGLRGYAVAFDGNRRAVGAPLAAPPFTMIDRVGGAEITWRSPQAVYMPAMPAIHDASRHGASVAFTDAGALVLGPANGCVWTEPDTCVNHAIGTPAESDVYPVRLLREVNRTWVDWLSLPTTGVLPRSQFGATIATEGTLVFVGASEWDYRPQDPAPHGDIVGAGAVYIYDLSEVDSDGDSMRDIDEVVNGLDPASASGPDGASGDADLDGVANAAEIAAGTHPTAPPENTRYFAEGATSGFFDTELALLNPGTRDADVLLRYLNADRSTRQSRVFVPRGERRSLEVASQPGMARAEFATVVESTTPIVADRVMRWAGDSTYGSHGERALVRPSTTWYLAEGATHSGFDLFYLLQNPSASDAQVHLRFLRPTGDPLEKDYVVAAGARVNVWVNVEQFPEGSGNRALASSDVSAVVTSTNGVPIVVERAIYLTHQGADPHAPDTIFEAGHESAGVTAPSEHWFFAEGSTGALFDMFLLIANPAATPASVRATYLLESGQTYQKTYAVAGGSRFTIWVDGETFDGVDGVPLESAAVSTTLEVVNGVGVVAERALWWPGPSFQSWSEAHNSPGATVTSAKWGVAAGRVRRDVPGRDNIDTYLLVANPGDTPARIAVSVILDDSAHVATRYFDVQPHSRLNVDVRTAFALTWELPSYPDVDFAFSATVESTGGPVVVEWAIYQDANGRFWAAGANALATPLP